MRFAAIRPTFWPFGMRAPATGVLHDADRLVSVWGDAAYEVASTLSWREDSGLVHTEAPGHWSRVRTEIGFRLGRTDDAPEADFVAKLGGSPALM